PGMDLQEARVAVYGRRSITGGPDRVAVPALGILGAEVDLFITDISEDLPKGDPLGRVGGTHTAHLVIEVRVRLALGLVFTGIPIPQPPIPVWEAVPAVLSIEHMAVIQLTQACFAHNNFALFAG